MANGGFNGTREEWTRLENPLIEIDQVLEDFAKKYSLKLTKNHKGWPERSITWGNNPKHLIQLFLVNEEHLTFNLWLCVSSDRGKKRYWKQENLVYDKSLNEFKANLPELLERGYEKLNSWKKSELEFYTELQG